MRWETGATRLLFLDPDTGATAVAFAGDLIDFLWWTDEQIVVSRYEGDRTTRYLLDLGSGALSPVGLPPDLDAGSVLWSPDRTRVAYTSQPSGAYDLDVRPTVMVYDLDSGERHTVPGSNTLENRPILWTSDDNLLFRKNIRGDGFDVAMSGDGGRETETVLGRLGANALSDVPRADNPACAP